MRKQDWRFWWVVCALAIVIAAAGWWFMSSAVSQQVQIEKIEKISLKADKIGLNVRKRPLVISAVGNVVMTMPEGVVRCRTLSATVKEGSKQGTLTPVSVVAEGGVVMDMHFVDKEGSKQNLKAKAQRAELEPEHSKLMLTGSPELEFSGLMQQLRQGAGRAGRITLSMDTGDVELEEEAELNFQIERPAPETKGKGEKAKE